MQLTPVAVVLALSLALVGPAAADSPARLAGELKQWHAVTLTLDGPHAAETDTAPNPFLDYRLEVTFTHTGSAAAPRHYVVPGYFAADGRAGETSANAGNQWRVHFTPDRTGEWQYAVSFVAGPRAAVDPAAPAQPVAPVHGATGRFRIAPSDKQGRDFRAHGRLEYTGGRYLRFAGSGREFLKAGADSPENLLAFADIDGTYSAKSAGVTRANEATTTALKTWAPHVRDWREGDPTWQGGKGRGLIGALNYLAGTGANAVSFLTYNAGGDGDDVWPFVTRDAKLHYDCSKLDQWQVVLDHAQRLGLYLHFKLQETENDDRILNDQPAAVPTALDGGDLGDERKLYLRELVARFAHALALNWNLGEENTQTPDQQRAMAAWLTAVDPYGHHRVIHTYPNQQEKVYPPLLGAGSLLTGASLQHGWSGSHRRVLHWITESARTGRPWVVAHDEQNPHFTGVPPDAGWEGFDGTARPEKYSRPYTADDIRKYTLWGTILAGGAGVEYYFGYTLPQNDLNCQDWRSRAGSWEYCRVALAFFADHLPALPVARGRPSALTLSDFRNADELVGNPGHDDTRYCFAAPGEVYLVYLPDGGTARLDLSLSSPARFDIRWYDPRRGGPLQTGSVTSVSAPGRVDLGTPPSSPDQDWLAVVSRTAAP